MNEHEPSTWQPPNWHPDWGDTTRHFQMLRDVASRVLGESSELSVRLDVVEEGYALVELFHRECKFGEVYVIQSVDQILKYCLYLYSEDDERSIEFEDIGVGLSAIREHLAELRESR